MLKHAYLVAKLATRILQKCLMQKHAYLVENFRFDAAEKQPRKGWKGELIRDGHVSNLTLSIEKPLVAGHDHLKPPSCPPLFSFIPSRCILPSLHSSSSTEGDNKTQISSKCLSNLQKENWLPHAENARNAHFSSRDSKWSNSLPASAKKSWNLLKKSNQEIDAL